MKPVKIKGVKFVVNDDGILTAMKNPWFRKDVTIPSVLPNGQQIKSLGAPFCYGKFGKITISDDIDHVNIGAFMGCDADEIVWSSKCELIPPICFVKSKVKKISNIDNVTTIHVCAFAASQIKSIDWPKDCLEIPEACFYASDIEEIRGLENVVRIGEKAFLETNNLKELNLSANSICDVEKTALGGVPREKVTFPYYSDSDYEDAFKIPNDD